MKYPWIGVFFLAGAAACGAATPSMAAAPAPPSPEEPAVRAKVERYLHGLKFNDVASFREAFLPEAKLYFVRRDGTLRTAFTQDKWYESFRENAGKEEAGELRIASVDVAGNAASVRVEEEYPGSRYVDYLSMLKIFRRVENRQQDLLRREKGRGGREVIGTAVFLAASLGCGPAALAHRIERLSSTARGHVGAAARILEERRTLAAWHR